MAVFQNVCEIPLTHIKIMFKQEKYFILDKTLLRQFNADIKS